MPAALYISQEETIMSKYTKMGFLLPIPQTNPKWKYWKVINPKNNKNATQKRVKVYKQK